MIDNIELEEIMNILENMNDEKLAVQLLAELNKKTAELGKLIRNLDPSIDNEEWKKKCDQAHHDVDVIVEKIMKQK